MGYLEKELSGKLENHFGAVATEDIEHSFKRYLDDCWIIWNARFGDLNEFHNILNQLDPNVKFTIESSAQEISFLDILLKRSEDNKIITDIFYKATDTKQYLEYGSCHPRQTKNTVPFTLARRICTIVTDSDLRTKRLNEL